MQIPFLSEKKPETDGKEGKAEKLSHGEPAKGQVAELRIGDTDKFDGKTGDGVSDGKET